MTNIAVIDGDSIIYYSIYNKEGEELKSIDDIFQTVDNYIHDILNKTETDYYSGFLTDGSFRYKVATLRPYKGNRSGIKPKYYHLVRGYLLDHYNFKTVNNYEADDLCIIIHKYFTENKEFIPIIATPDKDLKQIASIFYDYKKGELVEINKQDACKNLWKQVLTGDSGDNIPGIQGIGSVKADKILEKSDNYINTVLNEYIKAYGEYNGIEYFTENYKLVKLLNTCPDFIPNVNMLERKNDLEGWM